MCLLCQLPLANNHNFGQILTLLGAPVPYPPPFTDEGQMWCVGADPRSTLTRQISSECVHCVSFRWPKTTILGKILTFLGLLYRPPFTNEGQIWCAIADPWSTLTCQISSRSFILSPSGGKKKQFLPYFATFWKSAFSDVANWQQSEKVEHRCTTTNLPLSSGIKIVSVFQRHHGEIGCTISDVQKRDEQTNKQTKKLNVFGYPSGGLDSANFLKIAQGMCTCGAFIFCISIKSQ